MLSTLGREISLDSGTEDTSEETTLLVSEDAAEEETVLLRGFLELAVDDGTRAAAEEAADVCAGTVADFEEGVLSTALLFVSLTVFLDEGFCESGAAALELTAKTLMEA